MSHAVQTPNRRQFLVRLGGGAAAAGIGLACADRLCFGLALGATRDHLEFGALEPLVDLLQATPPDRLMPALVAKLRDGTDLHTLVAAGALANARTFGGEDYDGYHVQMALVPAYRMAMRMPERFAPLPVLKVLYRNAARIQAFGGGKRETLEAVASDDVAQQEDLLATARELELDSAERQLAGLVARDQDHAYQLVQVLMRDEMDVHRVVLAWRVLEGLEFTGEAHTLTMFRQALRMYVDRERSRIQKGRPTPEVRTDVPALLAEFDLLDRQPGTRRGDDAWVESLAHTLRTASSRDGARAVAKAYADGYSPDCLGEALSLAGTELLLHDAGRRRAEPGKPVGSVHGASVGVHASDSANAWRHIAEHGTPANVAASMVAGAYHTAGQGQHVGAEPFDGARRASSDSARVLRQELSACIRAADQEGASTTARQYVHCGHELRAAFEVFLDNAVQEDGALHAEKYYLTALEECTRSRPAFLERHVAAIARVSASQRCQPGPGVEDVRRLLAS